jgi:hypothetical protein
VLRAEARGDGFVLRGRRRGADAPRLRTPHQQRRPARGGSPRRSGPRSRATRRRHCALCARQLLQLAGRAPFSRLVYPLPEPGGLGVHLTLDLGGQARFGPDVEWIGAIDYTVDPRRGDAFYAEVRKYWPGLPDGALQPAYAGIRPKLSGPGEPAADFLVQSPAAHGVAGLVNLFGIESPGLTACLALAEHVCRELGL